MIHKMIDACIILLILALACCVRMAVIDRDRRAGDNRRAEMLNAFIDGEGDRFAVVDIDAVLEANKAAKDALANFVNDAKGEEE